MSQSTIFQFSKSGEMTCTTKSKSKRPTYIRQDTLSRYVTTPKPKSVSYKSRSQTQTTLEIHDVNVKGKSKFTKRRSVNTTERQAHRKHFSFYGFCRQRERVGSIGSVCLSIFDLLPYMSCTDLDSTAPEPEIVFEDMYWLY